MSNYKFIPHKKSMVDDAASSALFAMREQVLTDCNKYVRAYKWTMRDTSYTQFAPDDPLTLQVVYDTPYAKKVYYTGTPSTVQNPNASLEWCQKAADENAIIWCQILGGHFAQNIRSAAGVTGKIGAHVHLKK